MSSTPTRIGVVDYANVAPLVAGLASSQGGHGIDVRRAVPSRVAEWLGRGEIDLGLVPAIELGRLPGATVLPGFGIAADGGCGSVFLYSRAPLRDVSSVVLDGASRTSCALARILIDREGARDVMYRERDGGSVEDRLDGADATLLIGDPALRAATPPGTSRIDLATEWKRQTGLPFVFAAWIARPGFVVEPCLLRALWDAAERGLRSLPELARTESARTGIEVATLEAYFRQLVYRLDDRALHGLRAFLDEAWRLGLVPAPATIEIQG